MMIMNAMIGIEMQTLAMIETADETLTETKLVVAILADGLAAVALLRATTDMYHMILNCGRRSLPSTVGIAGGRKMMRTTHPVNKAMAVTGMPDLDILLL